MEDEIIFLPPILPIHDALRVIDSHLALPVPGLTTRVSLNLQYNNGVWEALGPPVGDIDLCTLDGLTRGECISILRRRNFLVAHRGLAMKKGG